MIVEVVSLSIGVLALLTIVPLSSQYGLDAGVAQALGSLAVQSNEVAYQIAETLLAVGATSMVWLLFRTRLAPRWLAISGLIGYKCLAPGAWLKSSESTWASLPDCQRRSSRILL